MLKTKNYKMLAWVLGQCLMLGFVPALAEAKSDMVVTAEMKTAAKQITTGSISAYTRFLSSDSLEGRGPATRADRVTQDYLRSVLEGFGIQPGAPGGGWIQTVPLVGMTTYAPDTLTLLHGSQKLTLKNHEDFITISGVQKPSAQIENAEIVFVGYGVVAPEFNWNDFKNIDLKGKVLLVMNHNPSAFAGKKRLYYGRWDYKFDQAAKLGAAGVIIIHTTPSAAYPWKVVQSSWSGKLFKLKQEGQPHLQVEAWATEKSSREIVKLAGMDLDKLRNAAESRDFKPVPLGVKMSINIKNSVTNTQSGNVIGMLPGSDPTLASEAIVYSAHYDHLGLKQNQTTNETQIYHGALDNAGGVAALLTIAKAYSHFDKPLKRTVYFVMTAAEEQGLLGAQYFVTHPPIPMNKIVANINIDGVGFYGKTRDVLVFGLGKSSLDNDLIALAATQDRTISPDPTPENGSFYRADQYSFAKAGVPVVYIYSGTDVIGKPASWGRQQLVKYIKNNYHQPSDKYQETFDFAGAVEDAQLEFYLGVNLANADGIPTWNKGDEFEAARLRSFGRHVS